MEITIPQTKEYVLQLLIDVQTMKTLIDELKIQVELLNNEIIDLRNNR